MYLLYVIIVGGIAGWLASLIYKGKGSGLILNILLGIIGGIVGNFLIGLIGFYSEETFLSSVITSTIGAVILLWIVNKLT